MDTGNRAVQEVQAGFPSLFLATMLLDMQHLCTAWNRLVHMLGFLERPSYRGHQAVKPGDLCVTMHARGQAITGWGLTEISKEG